MTGGRLPPADRLPTLTEVVELGREPARPAQEAVDPAPDIVIASVTPAPADVGGEPALGLAHVELLPLDEAALVDEVLAEVQRRVDLMFEYHVREALAPLLARLTDRLIVDTRETLAAAVRDVVARAVAQEVARRRRQSKP